MEIHGRKKFYNVGPRMECTSFAVKMINNGRKNVYNIEPQKVDFQLGGPALLLGSRLMANKQCWSVL
jgi:hypothetical protein